MIGKIVSGTSSGRKWPVSGTSPSAEDAIASFRRSPIAGGWNGILLAPQDQRRQVPATHPRLELAEAQPVERSSPTEERGHRIGVGPRRQVGPDVVLRNLALAHAQSRTPCGSRHRSSRTSPGPAGRTCSSVIASVGHRSNAMLSIRTSAVDIGARCGEQLRDAAARRMPDRRDAIQAEVVEQLADVGGLRADVERHAARLLGGAQPEQVRRDHAVTAREDRDQPTPQVRGQREPVQQQHRRAGALIEIRKLAPRGDESVHAPSRTIASATRSARTVSRDVVHAHSVGAVRDRQHGGGDRTLHASSRVLDLRQGADEPLARGADHHRGIEVAEALDGAKQREVVLEVLAEPDARDRRTDAPTAMPANTADSTRSRRNSWTSATTSS